jgi:hypothetical protein
MNKAPWIFLGVLLTLGLSWWGMVYGPALQIGGDSPDLGGGASLKARVGLARQGEQVYRENGCYYCHTRTATGGKFGYELRLSKLGGDRNATLDAIGKDRMEGVIDQAYVLKFVASLEAKAEDAKKALEDSNATLVAEKKKPEAEQKLASLQKKFNDLNATFIKASYEFSEASKSAAKQVKYADLSEADDLTSLGLAGLKLETTYAGIIGLAVDSLNATHTNAVKNARVSITSGTDQWPEIKRMVRLLKTRAGAQFKLQPIAGNWPDVQNNVAPRQSVSRDFLFDAHAMPGVMRLGPDLSNVGARLTGADNDAYAHLYDPQSTGKSSHMPPFRYLFKSVELKPDEALPGDAFLVEKMEGDKVTERIAVTPTAKARALLAFLKSLRTDRALPEAPLVETQSAAQE